MFLVIGSYSAAYRSGIHLFGFDEESKLFSPVKAVSGVENPSYLTVTPDGKNVYAVSEYKSGKFGKLSVFELEAGSWELTLTDHVNYVGAGSCFVSTDELARHAFVSNYGTGTLVVLRLIGKDDFTVCQTLQFSGSGPNPNRQEKPHIHSAMLSPGERFLYCADLGADRLYCYEYEPVAQEPLLPAAVPYVHLPAGSGPRHLAFSPDGRWLYLITELSGQIFAFQIYGNRSRWFQQISVPAPDYRGKVEAADLQAHPSGKYLYASHRGDANEIVVYDINPENGHLSLIQRVSAEGISPRSLLVWPGGTMLLSANEQSNNVTIFHIGKDGKLSYSGNELRLNKPTCLKAISSKFTARS
jgi:6-phosphogluconolactonase